MRLLIRAAAPWALTLLLGAAIMLGSGLGAALPMFGQALGAGVDVTLLTLMCLLLVEVRAAHLLQLRQASRFLLLACTANFVLVPLLGIVVATLFLSGQPLLFTGLLIYFLAPCTDWFLGFTRLAGGNTALGAALIPLNLVTQLLMFPVVLVLLARTPTELDLPGVLQTVWHWFLLPVLLATAIRALGHLFLPSAAAARLLRGASAAVPFVIAALIVQVFAANVGTIVASAGAFAIILAAATVFFAATYLLSETLTRLFRLAHPEHALLTMTMAARNAPMMLALTMVALPGYPLVHAAIVIGMLVEFPHLTALRHLLLRSQRRRGQPQSIQRRSSHPVLS
ncbi:MAG: hypothetical protein R6W83_08040 [Cryobacterium sp.]